MLQGLNPSPQVEMKFFNQQSDPVQGSDLCHRIFGDNANKRHKQFKAFFCLQDPAKQAPARKDRPTYKVDSFLKHLQMVSMSAWRLGRDISGDEQTIGFSGTLFQQVEDHLQGGGRRFPMRCIGGPRIHLDLLLLQSTSARKVDKASVFSIAFPNSGNV